MEYYPKISSTSIAVDPDVWQEFKMICAGRRLKIKNVVMDMVRDFVEKHRDNE